MSMTIQTGLTHRSILATKGRKKKNDEKEKVKKKIELKRQTGPGIMGIDEIGI